MISEFRKTISAKRRGVNFGSKELLEFPWTNDIKKTIKTLTNAPKMILIKDRAVLTLSSMTGVEINCQL
ncbi:MAG: hypothetical protein AABY07_04770 [Nanoarchaeota archaeon]